MSSRLLWRKSAAREGCFWSVFAVGTSVTASSFSALLFCVVLFVFLCRAVVFSPLHCAFVAPTLGLRSLSVVLLFLL